MSNDIPHEAHVLLRQVVPEIEEIVNTYIKEDLKQDSVVSRQYVYNRALRKIMHNFENSHEQDIEDIIDHVSKYTVKRLGQIYYDAWEYKHKGMNLDRVQTPSAVLFQQPYQIMYERPFVNSNQQEIELRQRENYWFSTD